MSMYIISRSTRNLPEECGQFQTMYKSDIMFAITNNKYLKLGKLKEHYSPG